MCASPNFGQRDPATYREICEDALPPLWQLVAEHNRMLREIAAAERMAQSSFWRTMARWHARELKGEE